jgi:predicted phosphodiesterase
MKIAIASDIHLEFKPIILRNDENADVLVLAGDILTANHLTRESYLKPAIDSFTNSCVSNFKDVIYIAGNHEHYDHDFQRTHTVLRDYFKHDNLHILEKQSIVIGDVTFIGGTMWSDMDKSNPNTLLNIRAMMNDFILVTNDHGRRTFTPEDSVEDHHEMVKFILDSIKDSSNKYVVVSHHAPSELSIHPKYKADALSLIMNSAYYSSLEHIMLDHPQIKYWIHGHTHTSFDYMMGQTRVICNPRGYPGQTRNFKLKYVEV